MRQHWETYTPDILDLQILHVYTRVKIWRITLCALTFERGRRACSLDLMAQIALTYDVSLDFLILGKKSQTDAAKEKLAGAIEIIEQAKRML